MTDNRLCCKKRRKGSRKLVSITEYQESKRYLKLLKIRGDDVIFLGNLRNFSVGFAVSDYENMIKEEITRFQRFL